MLGEYHKAKECFEKAIEINPNHLGAYNNLGLVFKELKEYQKAKSCIEKALEIDPYYAKAHNNLGLVFRILEEPEKAKACYEKAIANDCNDIDAIHALSDMLRLYTFNYKSEANKNNFKELILLLFRKDNIKHTNITVNAKLLLLTTDAQNQLLKDINSETLLENKVSQN